MTESTKRAVWDTIRNWPTPVTTREISEKLGMPLPTVSSLLTDLFRRNMVVRQDRTFYDERARKQTQFEYSTAMSTWAERPLVLAPVAPRSTRNVPIYGNPVRTTPKTTLVKPAVEVDPRQMELPLAAPVTHKEAAIVKLTEAEEFAAYLEFKRMKKQITG
jgi:hypothetical protein